LNSPSEVPSWEDNEGNTITPRVYDNGAIYTEGVVVKTWKEDADGNPVLDDNGDPIPDETEPNTILVEGRRIHQWNSSGWGPSPSDGSIIETSWIRMTELSLSYTFPKNWINKAFLQNLSLAATVRNAFFIYNNAPMNIDPSGSTSAGHVNGIEFGSLPTRRQIALTVRVGF
jgi:iron complex outermembrane receptor protein